MSKNTPKPTIKVGRPATTMKIANNLVAGRFYVIDSESWLDYEPQTFYLRSDHKQPVSILEEIVAGSMVLYLGTTPSSDGITHHKIGFGESFGLISDRNVVFYEVEFGLE
jgi:hypothetical protein